MTFLIPNPNGPKRYVPGGHTRDELKFAFKRLRAEGHGKESILLAAIVGELYPFIWKRRPNYWNFERPTVTAADGMETFRFSSHPPTFTD